MSKKFNKVKSALTIGKSLLQPRVMTYLKSSDKCQLRDIKTGHRVEMTRILYTLLSDLRFKWIVHFVLIDKQGEIATQLIHISNDQYQVDLAAIMKDQFNEFLVGSDYIDAGYIARIGSEELSEADVIRIFGRELEGT